MDAETALSPNGFDALQTELLESEIQVWPTRSWNPSAVGHPCDRYLVWRWNRHAEQARHSPTLQSIFNEGKDHQPRITARLQALGYDVVEIDRPTEYTVAGGARISGKLDGKLRAFRGERYRPDIVLEAKTAEAHAWQTLHTAEDIKKASSPWTRGYYAQGQLYCLLENLERGVFVIKNKGTGLLKFLPFDLDYSYAEGVLRRIERLQPFVVTRQDPPPIPYDPKTCGRCSFNRMCWPPRSFGEGVVVLDHPELVEHLEARAQLDESATEYDQHDRAVKAILKGLGVTSAIVGEWSIEARERAVRQFTVPARTDRIYDIQRSTRETRP